MNLITVRSVREGVAKNIGHMFRVSSRLDAVPKGMGSTKRIAKDELVLTNVMNGEGPHRTAVECYRNEEG